MEPASGTARHPALASNSNPLYYLESLAAQDGDGDGDGEGGPSPGTPPSHPVTSSPSARQLGAKLNSNSLRLCNNHLMSLHGLGRVMRHVLDDPRQLVWLDVRWVSAQDGKAAGRKPAGIGWGPGCLSHGVPDVVTRSRHFGIRALTAERQCGKWTSRPA